MSVFRLQLSQFLRRQVEAIIRSGGFRSNDAGGGRPRRPWPSPQYYIREALVLVIPRFLAACAKANPQHHAFWKTSAHSVPTATALVMRKAVRQRLSSTQFCSSERSAARIILQEYDNKRRHNQGILCNADSERRARFDEQDDLKSCKQGKQQSTSAHPARS